ncbi:IS200/IS605 family transposase, partial [Megasphaera hexanoica]|nr:IS200/IS605 family transposase [Megasphaera hexanoica]
MKLDSNNHSVFLLYYHLVLVVKYRRKVFSIQNYQNSS